MGGTYHAAGNGPVANHGNAVVHPFVGELFAYGHPQGGGDGGGGVAGAEGVVFAFGAFGKARETVWVGGWVGGWTNQDNVRRTRDR